MTRTSSRSRVVWVLWCIGLTALASTTLATTGNAPATGSNIKRVRGVVGYRKHQLEESHDEQQQQQQQHYAEERQLPAVGGVGGDSIYDEGSNLPAEEGTGRSGKKGKKGGKKGRSYPSGSRYQRSAKYDKSAKKAAKKAAKEAASDARSGQECFEVDARSGKQKSAKGKSVKSEKGARSASGSKLNIVPVPAEPESGTGTGYRGRKRRLKGKKSSLSAAEAESARSGKVKKVKRVKCKSGVFGTSGDTSGVPDREYPPAEVMQQETPMANTFSGSGSKVKSAKSEKSGSKGKSQTSAMAATATSATGKSAKSAKSGKSAKAASAQGATAEDTSRSKMTKSEKKAEKKAAKLAARCARQGAASKDKSAKKGTKGSKLKSGSRTRGLKSGTDKTAKSAKKDKSAARSAECDEFTDYSGPLREYPPDYGPTTTTTSTGATSTVYQGQSGTLYDSDSGSAVGPVVEPKSVACKDISLEKGPVDDDHTTFTILAELQVQTRDVDKFYRDLQKELQKEVAMVVAGCGSERDKTQGYITNVLFALPSQAMDYECTTLTRRSLISATAKQYLPETAPQAQGDSAASSLANNDQDPAIYAPPPPHKGGPAERQADPRPGPGPPGSTTACLPTKIFVNVYHYMPLDDEGAVKDRLKAQILSLDLRELTGVNSESVQIDNVSESRTEISAARAVNHDSVPQTKTIAYSAGIAGFVLMSLIMLKVSCSRKRRTDRVKKLYADFDDARTDFDDETFVYPTEEELVGPECADLRLVEANDRYAQRQDRGGLGYTKSFRGHGREESKGSAYILDDLNQEAMSVETDPSFMSRPVSYRHVPPTPHSRRHNCC